MKTAKHSEVMKNPVATGRRSESPFLLLDEEYPLKPWISRTGEHFQTVSVRQDDGAYLALIVEDPETRCSAATRLQAEDGVKRRFFLSLSHSKNFGGGDTHGRAGPGDVEPSPDRCGSTRVLSPPFRAFAGRSW
jgi:hypothetical protein